MDDKKTRRLDAYLSESFDGSFEEALVRADEIATAMNEVFRDVSVSISDPDKDAKGNRPKGFSINVSAYGHSSDVYRHDYEDTSPVGEAEIVDVLTTPVPLHG